MLETSVRLRQSSQSTSCNYSCGRASPKPSTKNSERREKSRVLGFSTIVFFGMLKHARSIVAVLARRFRSRAVLELENLALRHQLHVLRRQRPGRPRLFKIDRSLWVWLYRLWPRCLDTMVLVKPATVVQWHRQGFRLFWRWRSRSGRPSVDREVRKLIREMSGANPLWGAPRIHGELLKLGIEIKQARAPSILIVDDSSDNRLLLRAFFKGVPCALDEAENGRQAIDMVAARRYDLILMDIRMPVMDGYAAVRQIRKREQQLGVLPVPIIALTASGLQEELRECLASGCSFHISKPIGKAALLDAVNRATAASPVEATVAENR